MISLANKTALVTGGGRGIGKTIALRLAEAGADVAVCDLDSDAAAQTAREIEAMGRKACSAKANVANSADVTALIETVLGAFSKIDILVNNAGITRDGLLVRMKEEDWDLVLDVNLKSAFLCTKEVARPMMKARTGKIINIASVVGIIGNAGQANYSASKAGLIGLTKTLAREFSSRNIMVNAVAPGFIQTAMTDKLSATEKEKLAAGIPLASLGQPADVANAVLFLASDLSDYITGQVLAVDGGLAM